jgi:hypothetical protein
MVRKVEIIIIIKIKGILILLLKNKENIMIKVVKIIFI